MWTYRQLTGELFNPTGERVGIGYAGHGEGTNDPAMETIANVGPLPRGRYFIGPEYSHPKLGPVTMNLTPQGGTETFGRSDFRIHGDNATHDASHGCIVQNNDVRVLVSQSPDHDLEVIA